MIGLFLLLVLGMDEAVAQQKSRITVLMFETTFESRKTYADPL